MSDPVGVTLAKVTTTVEHSLATMEAISSTVTATREELIGLARDFTHLRTRVEGNAALRDRIDALGERILALESSLARIVEGSGREHQLRVEGTKGRYALWVAIAAGIAGIASGALALFK